MPEVTGFVNDPIRRKSYIVKMAGSDAAEVFVFNMRRKYDRSDVLQIPSVPTIVTSTDAEDIVDAKKGHYILADIEMQDTLCDDGEYLCPIIGERFTKQATIFPYDTMTMIITGYLRNGEMLLAPIHPKRKFHRTLIYPISLIEIGSITDLDTPVSLAICKKKLFEARALEKDDVPEHINIEPSTSHFQPIQDDNTADDTMASAASTASMDSTYISGTLNIGKTTTATRARCGLEVERRLQTALSGATNPDFAPWMTSTGSTPPSSRPSSAQSLPAELGSPDKQDSPDRPKSTSPTKQGRKGARKANKDKTYQPKIRGFLTPTSPQSPIPPRTPLPGRGKRRSQRLPEDQMAEPASKKQATSPETFNKTVRPTPMNVEETSSSFHTARDTSDTSDDSILVIKEITKRQKMAESQKLPPILIDLDNDVTPKDSERSDSMEIDIPMEQDPNKDVNKGQAQHTAAIPGSIPTPPISASSSRANSMTTNRAGSTPITLSSTESLPTIDPNPYIDPVPGPSCVGHHISLHSNIPMDQDPKHVLIKASQDHVHVKIVTFEAQNLEAIVKCFFQDTSNTDTPVASPDSTLEELVNSSHSSNPDKPSIIARMTKFLTSTIQTFAKRDDTPTNESGADFDDEETLKKGEDEGEEDNEEEETEGGKGNAN